jgi:hypothetical protein
MAMSPNRVKIEIPKPLHAELKARAQREGRPATAVLVELIGNGKRLENLAGSLAAARG